MLRAAPIAFTLKILEAEGSGHVLFHCLGHWRIEPSMHDIAYLDGVCLPASQLLHGRPVRFWHDQ